MVDQKLTQLGSNTTPTKDDIIYLVNDPAGTPASQQLSLENFFKVINNLTAVTDLGSDSADEIVIYDSTGAVSRKITVDNFFKGIHDISIPAFGFYTPNTEPATFATTEFGAAGNKITLKTMNFTSTTVDERAQCRFPLPRNYDLGNIDIEIYYSFASGSGNIRWGARAVATGDNEAIATNFGTAVEGNDTAGTADQVNKFSLTGITIGNTPAAGDEIHLEIYREGSDAGDTFTGTARLHGIVVRVGVNKKASA